MSVGQNLAVSKPIEPDPSRAKADTTADRGGGESSRASDDLRESVEEIHRSLDEVRETVGALDSPAEARAKFEQLQHRSNASGPAIGSTLPSRGRPAGMPVLLQLFGLGFELISYIIAATLLGWGVGYLLGNTRIGLLVGIVIGAIIGMIQMVRSAYRLTEPKAR